MKQQKLWRVRVKLAVESWVEIAADTPLIAEAEAAKLPGVISVFGRSAIPGDQPAASRTPIGVQEEMF